jgi:hypothetical protein
LQSPMGGILCAREILPCPHPGLCKGGAESFALASAGQARGRGSTRTPGAPERRLCKSPSRGPSKAPGAGRKGPRGPLACKDAVIDAGKYAHFRRIPWVSSEPLGAPALLPEGRRQRSIAQAVWRLRREETARASV